MKNLVKKIPIVLLGALLFSSVTQAMKRTHEGEQDREGIKKPKTVRAPQQFLLPEKFADKAKTKFSWLDAKENEYLEVLLEDANSIAALNNLFQDVEEVANTVTKLDVPLETLKKFFSCLHIIVVTDEEKNGDANKLEKLKKDKKERLINYINRAVSISELRDMLQQAHSLEATLLLPIFSEQWLKRFSADSKIVQEQAPLSQDCSRALALMKEHKESSLHKEVEAWLTSLYLPTKLPSDGTLSACMCMSPNAEFFVAGSTKSNGALSVWQKKNANFELMQSLAGHERVVSALAFSKDSQTLASGDRAGRILLWVLNGREWHLKATLSHHDMHIYSLAFRPQTPNAELPMLASGSFDRTLALWDVEHGDLIISLSNEALKQSPSGIVSLCFNPQEATLLFKNDKAIKVLNLQNMDSQQLCPSNFHENFSISISPNGKNITALSENGVKIVSNIDGLWIEKFLVNLENCYTAFFETDTKVVALSSLNLGESIVQRVVLWNFIQGTWLSQAAVHLAHKKFMSIHVSPDCQTLASKSEENEIALWKLPMMWMVSEVIAGMTLEQCMLIKLIIAAEKNSDILNLVGYLVDVFNTMPESFKSYLKENCLLILPPDYEM